MPDLRLPSSSVLDRLFPRLALASAFLVGAVAFVAVRSDGVGGGLFEFSRSRLEVGTRAEPPSILLIGDTGAASPEFRANVRAMEHERALVAVHTGDVSYHGPKDYRRFLDVVDDLPFPLFAVPGDHDRDRDPDLSQYDSLIGGRDRVVDVGGLRLVLLDTSAETVSEESFLFLERALASPPSPEWTVVATHCPPYEPGRAPGEGHAIRSAEQSKRLLDMLAAADVDLLACGHIHGFRDLTHGPVPIVITGGGGRSVEPGDSFHYVRVTLGKPLKVVEVVTSGPRGRDPIGRSFDSAVGLLLWNGKTISIGAAVVVALLAALRWRRSLAKLITYAVAPSGSRATPRLPMSRGTASVWRFRHGIACLPLGFALVSTRWEWEYDPGIWSIAVALSLAGIAVRGCALRYGDPILPIRDGSLPSGPYSRVRQPLYVGSVLLIAASVVASELIWLLPAAVAWAMLVYERASRWEEATLASLYSDRFEAYRDRVPKWIPRAMGPTPVATPAVVPLRDVLIAQWPLVLGLLPFVFKELNPFGFWPMH